MRLKNPSYIFPRCRQFCHMTLKTSHTLSCGIRKDGVQDGDFSVSRLTKRTLFQII